MYLTARGEPVSSNGFGEQTTAVPLRWILTVTVLFVVGAAAVWSYIIVSRPAAVQQPTVTPVLLVIAPERTSTTVLDAPVTDTPAPLQTPTFPPPPAGSLIKVGSYVQVVNTGGGLRLRYEPNLESEVNYLALDYEVFVVQKGPREADDITWWFLVAQADDRRNGWGASNYLQVVR